MKAFAFSLLATFLLLLPVAARCDGPVQVDVLYMNHAPLRPTLEDLRATFAAYGERVAVAWHDVDTDEGAKFKAAKRISGHVPLVVWVNGSHRHRVDGREVAFTGFPTGAGPELFQGRWTVAELRKVLDRLTAGK